MSLYQLDILYGVLVSVLIVLYIVIKIAKRHKLKSHK